MFARQYDINETPTLHVNARNAKPPESPVGNIS